VVDVSDILHQIDATLAAVTESMERNRERFDPFGPLIPRWWTSGIEERAVEAVAVVEEPAPGERAFRQAFVEIAAEREAALAFGVDSAADGSATMAIASMDSDGHMRVEVVAPPVDAALQPDPDEPERTCILCDGSGRHDHLAPPPSPLYCAGCLRDITSSGVCTRCPEPPWAAEMRARIARAGRPWWRPRWWR
jgi:hypothetical protein